MKKAEAIEVVQGMPDEFEAEDLLYRLYVREKVERAEQAVADGRVLTHEEMTREIASWSK
jgi:predicted transcriptional regulator